MAGFRDLAQLPMCAGAIDGTFVHIKKLSLSGEITTGAIKTSLRFTCWQYVTTGISSPTWMLEDRAVSEMLSAMLKALCGDELLVEHGCREMSKTLTAPPYDPTSLVTAPSLLNPNC